MATFKTYAGTIVCLTQCDPVQNFIEGKCGYTTAEMYPHKLYKLGLCKKCSTIQKQLGLFTDSMCSDAESLLHIDIHDCH